MHHPNQKKKKKTQPLSRRSSIYTDPLRGDVSSQHCSRTFSLLWEPAWLCWQHLGCSVQSSTEGRSNHFGGKHRGFQLFQFRKILYSCTQPPLWHSKRITEIIFCRLSWHRYFEIVLSFNASTLPRQLSFKAPDVYPMRILCCDSLWVKLLCSSLLGICLFTRKRKTMTENPKPAWY